MNVVLYTEDFEPITVLDLPLWLLEKLEKQGQVQVQVQDPVDVRNLALSEPVNKLKAPRVVTIRCEKLHWKGKFVKSVLITPNEELALILRPDWLPGQRAAVNDYKATISFLANKLTEALRKN